MLSVLIRGTSANVVPDPALDQHPVTIVPENRAIGYIVVVIESDIVVQLQVNVIPEHAIGRMPETAVFLKLDVPIGSKVVTGQIESVSAIRTRAGPLPDLRPVTVIGAHSHAVAVVMTCPGTGKGVCQIAGPFLPERQFPYLVAGAVIDKLVEAPFGSLVRVRGHHEMISAAVRRVVPGGSFALAVMCIALVRGPPGV